MIYIGCDHGGFRLKSVLMNYLANKGIEYEDCGTFSEDSVDYPDIAKTVCDKVVNNKALGILVCGTGVGMSIAANKVEGIRAVVTTDCFSARMSRVHNNANVLCLGQRVLGDSLAQLILEEFLESEFEGGRHERRVGKIMELDSRC